MGLVSSVADDLGVDLETRPSTHDDELFYSAPVQGSSATCATPQHSIPEALEQSITQEFEPVEDPWLEQTRRQFTELSEARGQLMDELDDIVEGSSVLLEEERREVEPWFDSDQRIHRKVPSILSSRPTRLRDRSVESIAAEETTQRDLAHEPRIEELRQPEYEQEHEPESGSVQKTGVVHSYSTLPRCSYLEPLVELQDRIADLEPLLRQDVVQLPASETELIRSPILPDQEVGSGSVSYGTPVERTAEDDFEDETTFEAKSSRYIVTRQPTVLPPQNPVQMSRRASDQRPFTVSSSEL